LAGVRDKENGSPAPLLFVSDSQVTFQCPASADNSRIEVTVESEQEVLSVIDDVFFEASPALFTLDSFHPTQGAVVISSSNELAMPAVEGVPSRPAKRGERISIYANGLGLPEENVPVGAPAPLDRLFRVQNTTRVVVGGINVDPIFAGLAPGSIGLYQINIDIPEGVPAGEAVPLQVEVTLSDGRIVLSNTVTLAIGE
jgi:uncharacterized protein (TIGR03437 family)